ncbi:hypothetical protein AS156_25770 [Bradyrhizobium macuxiense]|uniref:Helix-turn-helix protein n=1 Tax=Bradyrhizobium macuxiense TaxID=1755647 RepID=A0A109K5F9_9BRAD|nr:hypothetical protein [Bradyrhizobium macuxiense]KWV61128.1 hypothetical protein AS156_25770 [Bradyrhizobium macuxiense]
MTENSKQPISAIETPAKGIWRKRRFVSSHETPEGALTWRSVTQRKKKLCDWRIATMQRYPECSRLLRIAWTLEGLAVGRGYAFASDPVLAKMAGVEVRNLQRALKQLEDDDVIIRASISIHSDKGWKAERRIWLSAKVIKSIPVTVTGTDTGHGDHKTTGYGDRTEAKEETQSPIIDRKRGLSSTQLAAKRSAEINAKKRKNP